MDFQGHWFGLPVPFGVTPVRSWGARAILRVQVEKKPVRVKGRIRGYDLRSTPVIEFVPDRSQYRGPDREAPGPEAKAFFKWIDKKAMPRLRKDADKLGLALNDELTLRVDEGPFHLRANPKKSYGYLYICAWEGDDDAQQA
jgi:hypothetical protein